MATKSGPRSLETDVKLNSYLSSLGRLTRIRILPPPPKLLGQRTTFTDTFILPGGYTLLGVSLNAH